MELMTIDAGHHGNGSFLPQDILIAHYAVAHDTVHLCVGVLLVTEENKRWQLICPNPGDFPVLLFELR